MLMHIVSPVMSLAILLKGLVLMLASSSSSSVVLSFPRVFSHCGLASFEKDASLNGYVYNENKIGSMNTSSVLTCAANCLYDTPCMSVVYQQHIGICHMYLTHMADTYPKIAEGTAVYVQFEDPDVCPLCDSDASCINKRGKDLCHCNDGYDGDGETCSDIDECSTDTHNCDVNAQCTNTPGSYSCQCNNMYSGTGQMCTLNQIRGESCSEDADCLRTHFICYSGVCDCALSYSYNGTSNTCVTKCDKYGSEFTMQSSPYCISQYNDATYEISTFDGCRLKCLEADFTCRTFELYESKCYLSTNVKLDVPGNFWEVWTGCLYYQRHCA